MCYIPDPTEILERQIDRQFDLVDENNTYPCCKCGRRFFVDEMYAISSHPVSPLECGLEECESIEKSNKSREIS
jgi:hypothetical protein